MARGFLAPFGFGQGADPFTLLRQEVEQLFDNVARAPSPGSGGTGLVMAPRMDVVEDDNQIRITAEMPGVAPDKIDVTVNDDLLTIRGEREMEQRAERRNYHLIERVHGSFQRTLRLPYPVDASQVQARFEDGVLTITLPKSGSRQGAQRIEVSRGGAQPATGQDNAGGDTKTH